MPSFTLPDQSSLFYLDENPGASGDAVLLLHGLGATSESWALQIPALTAADLRVIAADTPGFGRSLAVRPYRSIADMTAFIPALLGRLGLERISLVGISMGGAQALQFTLQQPAAVARLALVNTFARLDLYNPAVWPYYLSRLALVYGRGLPAQARAVSQRIFPLPEHEQLRAELVRQVLQSQPQIYRSAMRALALFNQQSRLGEIAVPALVITGDRDTTVPPVVQRRLAQDIASARHVTVANAGHAVSIEQPDQFNNLIVDFLCAEPYHSSSVPMSARPNPSELRM